MEKGGEFRRGGCSRFSTPTRPTGDGFFDNSSKKEKLRRLSEMDQLSHSITTNSTSKRVKLPKKFYDQCGIINHSSVPRKPRSAMKKREQEPLAIEETTEDEEEAAEALIALARTFPNKPEPSEPHGSLVHTKRKRCWVHVHICHLINALKSTKSEEPGSNPHQWPALDIMAAGGGSHLNCSRAPPHSQWLTQCWDQRFLSGGSYVNWPNGNPFSGLFVVDSGPTLKLSL